MFHRCRVFAFEPEALNYARLNQNIVRDGLSEVVTAYCLAISAVAENRISEAKFRDLKIKPLGSGR